MNNNNTRAKPITNSDTFDKSFATHVLNLSILFTRFFFFSHFIVHSFWVSLASFCWMIFCFQLFFLFQFYGAQERERAFDSMKFFDEKKSNQICSNILRVISNAHKVYQFSIYLFSLVKIHIVDPYFQFSTDFNFELFILIWIFRFFLLFCLKHFLMQTLSRIHARNCTNQNCKQITINFQTQWIRPNKQK